MVSPELFKREQTLFSGGADPVMPESKPALEAIGIRVLGEVDPRILSKEDFENSPDILFHGAGKPFKYHQKYDYSSAEYFTDGDGSQTIGEGFYTTDSRNAAENYSQVRQGTEESTPFTVTLLPYEARVLDLRASADKSRNAPVPSDIFEKWFQFYKSYYFGKDEKARKNESWVIQNIESDYWKFLNRAKDIAGNEGIDLRVMLDTAPHPKLDGHNLPQPPYVKLFSNFMRQEKIDGLIYNEGGEGANSKSHSSYIFFNLEKVGTQDSWQENTK